MNEDDFSRLPPAAQAYIRELESSNRQLGERIAQLEEQFRLAQSKRFAPSSEKLRDRVFDEAAQIAATEAHDEDVADNTFTLPDTGLPDAPEPVRRSPGRKPLPADLPRQRIEYDLPDDQKICPCCAHELHRMGEEISEQLHIEAKASVLQHVRFKYQPGRGQEYPQAFLAGYQGLLMTDGYAAWRTLEGPTHFGCLAHARRAFVDALKGMKKPGGRAAQALEGCVALRMRE
ncbi:hypothetical protein OKW38_000397 [Paraburkholderia sp. MM5496-R1]